MPLILNPVCRRYYWWTTDSTPIWYISHSPISLQSLFSSLIISISIPSRIHPPPPLQGHLALVRLLDAGTIPKITDTEIAVLGTTKRKFRVSLWKKGWERLQRCDIPAIQLLPFVEFWWSNMEARSHQHEDQACRSPRSAAYGSTCYGCDKLLYTMNKISLLFLYYGTRISAGMTEKKIKRHYSHEHA